MSSLALQALQQRKLSEDDDDWPGGFAPCYILWAVTVLLSLTTFVQAAKAAAVARTMPQLKQAWARWEVAKRHSFFLFVFCTFFHFIASSWMGSTWVSLALAPCIAIGIVLPVCFCAHGDKAMKQKHEALRRQAREILRAQPAGQPPLSPVPPPPLDPVVPVGQVVVAPAAVHAVPSVVVIEAQQLAVGETPAAEALPMGEAPPIPAIAPVIVSGVAIRTEAATPPPHRDGGGGGDGAPTLSEICALLRRELSIPPSLNMKQTIDEAAKELDVFAADAQLLEKARLCWVALGSPMPSLQA